MMTIFMLIYALLLLLLLKLPLVFAISIACMIVAVSFTVLFLYRKPKFLNAKTIRLFEPILVGIFIFSLLVFIAKGSLVILVISLAGCIGHICFRSKGAEKVAVPKKAASEEDRRALRSSLCFDIELHSLEDKDKEYRCVTKDVSTSGMKVFSEHDFKKGENFYFRLYLPEESWPLVGEAEVKWQQAVQGGFEYGMIFTKMNDQNRGKLALKQGFSLLE